MPRPGPRPYECVRRAWHSERHQPIRGLVIQQIFRLVHDNHSAATKKNKEWQEKLPIVVLKAEEIMYSKANSEAEYSNIETLWDRVNDAVDTIIRKDDTTETGELLPPCVEAALNLGCVPVRASRSQRHNNPRTYLRPSYQECNNSMSPRFLKDNVNERNPDLMPAQTTSSSMLKMPQHVDSARLVWESNKRIAPISTNQHIASSFEKLHCIGNKNGVELECNASLSRTSVYPLYYGMTFKPEVRQLGFQEAQKSDSVIIGVPVFSSPAEPAAEGGCLQNLFPYGEDKFLGKRTCEVASKDSKGKGPQAGFDLSLRLGLFSDSNSSREKVSGFVTDSLGRRVSPYEGLPVEKEFPFFPMESAHNPTQLHNSKQNEESENQNAELVSRKRKLSFSGDLGNDQFFWSQDSTNHFVGQMRRPDCMYMQLGVLS
ncbi:uncharacterized protein LOC131003074 isoform X1 [Salvia miltiorrhiza]|uniref:uncharacterized protein LOC131003074 isoform X1 n=2 Tax=Salvia miltiorrhiza TaxID=226208 RepID=UPI0025ACF544|nr:uncharacterized protein LOC131003074 isoform X1 [Salvia miltiorrhiza]